MDDRATALGQDAVLSSVDRFGIWLSSRRMRAALGSARGKRFADIGCGFEARASRRLIDEAASSLLVDLAIAEDLKAHPRVEAVEGLLPGALAGVPDASIDLLACTSVLEHVVEDDVLLAELRRVLAPGGRCFLNVPSWLGKHFLELVAFRLRLGESAPLEMDDHKRYYDPKDLWPLLVAAGFRPHGITCRRHKAGLNTYALCRVDP